MKRIKWLIGIVVALAATILITNSSMANIDRMNNDQGKLSPTETKLLPLLDQLSKYSTNAFRRIDEYDTNDESKDPLLWSEKKTVEEIAVLLKELLNDRRTLHSATDLNRLAYEGRVRRWNFTVPEGKNGYQTMTIVFGQIVDIYSTLTPLYAMELDEALKMNYYPEAIHILKKLYSDNDKTLNERIELYKKALPRFGNSPEALFIQTQIVALEASRDLGDMDKQLKLTDQEWNKYDDYYSQKLNKLKPKFAGNPYGTELIELTKNIIIDAFGYPQVVITSFEKGEVKIEIKGIIRSEWELRRIPQQMSQSLTRTSGEVIHSFAGAPKRRINTTITDRLPKVGTYRYFFYNKTKDKVDDYPIMTNVDYSQLWTTYDQKKNIVSVRVVHHSDARPVEGVEVRLESDSQTKQLLDTFKTDKNGDLAFTLDKYKGEAFKVRVVDDRLSDGVMQFYAYKVSDNNGGSFKPYDDVDFYTDRPLYRRGQKVSVGIVLTHVDKEKTTLRKNTSGKIQFKAFRNDKPEVLAEQSFTTNQNGVAELTFDIPKDETLNNFSLRTEDDEYKIEVQDYKLNYLSIEVDSIPTGAVTGKPMKIFGRTTDLNGNPVPAKVEITYNGKERISGESRNDGRFEMAFSALPKLTQYYWRSVGISLKATDALGNVASNNYTIIPNDSTNMPLEARSLVQSTSINKTKFTLSTERQPYHSTPLGDLSRYHLMATLISQSTKHRTELGELPTKGTKEFSLPDLPSGKYSIELSVVDYYGNTITNTDTTYYFFSPSDTRLFDGKEELIEYLKDEKVILYGFKNSGYLHFETFTKGNGIPTHRIEKIEAGKLYRMKIQDPNVSKVDLFTIHEGYPLSRSISINESNQGIESDSPLSLSGMEIKDSESFLPGAQFTRTLTIKDENNNPVKHSPVFVTVFDKAVADAAGGREFWSRIVQDHRPDVSPYWGTESLSEVMVMSDHRPQLQMAGRTMSRNAAEYKSAAPRAMDTAGGAEAPTSEIRRNFVETAYFSTLLLTDAEGKVKLDFKLPDTQTKYVTKVYTFTPDVEKDLMKDYEFEVYSPLSIEISMPRYLHWGDQLHGEVRLMNTDDKVQSVSYSLVRGNQVLLNGSAIVQAKSTQAVPFTLPVSADMGQEITLTAQAKSTTAQDTVERKLTLLSDQYSYIVATPLSIYHQKGATLQLKKTDALQGNALLDLYFSPAHVVLSGLANEYAVMGKVSDMSLFEAVHCFAIYAELQEFLASNAAVRSDLQASLQALKASGAIEASGDTSVRSDRQTLAKELAKFYEFILDKEKLNSHLLSLQTQILKFRHPHGGFSFSTKNPEPSPWLTSYILDRLSGAARRVATTEMRSAFDDAFKMIFDKMNHTNSWFRYSDYMGYRMLLHEYGKSDKQLLERFGSKLKEQVTNARKDYQTTSNSYLIRFAKYSRIFDDKGTYAQVEQFIRDRSKYTRSDRELLLLALFTSSGQQTAVDDEVIQFMLQLKQGTIWEDPFTLEAVKVLLRQVAPTTFTSDAALLVGSERHRLTPIEKATGRVQLPLTSLNSELKVEWPGVEAEYVFGGIRYSVSEPISQVTPTGEKLKVLKEIYARRIIDGKAQLIRVTPDKPAHQGEQIVVRYLVETAQDLSLVTLKDERPAGAEPGYDFEGYGIADRVWWSYTRRDTADYLFIDYLPRGKHAFEIEATATLGGHFGYGPAQVQSYYAPEYAGNSAGGQMSIRPNNSDSSFVLIPEK